MKKIISVFLCCVILLSSACVFASATNDVYTYEIDGIEYTVQITDDNINENKKQSIANALVNAEVSEAVPANIWCDIFGHDYKYTTASVVSHKVRTSAPRCKVDYYNVTYCEDCDYTQQTYTGTEYINCCS